jgi:hypothetical protein
MFAPISQKTIFLFFSNFLIQLMVSGSFIKKVFKRYLVKVFGIKKNIFFFFLCINEFFFYLIK